MPSLVAIAAPLPHASLLELDVAALVERAVARVAKKTRNRRVAVFSARTRRTSSSPRRALRARGCDGKRLSLLHVTPVGCEALTALLFDRRRSSGGRARHG